MTGDRAALLRVTSNELAHLLSAWGQRGFARCEQEGFTFCWTSLNGAVRRSTASSSGASKIAGFVEAAIKSQNIGLAKYLR